MKHFKEIKRILLQIFFLEKALFRGITLIFPSISEYDQFGTFTLSKSSIINERNLEVP